MGRKVNVSPRQRAPVVGKRELGRKKIDVLQRDKQKTAFKKNKGQ
jgi:hypothetical protein